MKYLISCESVAGTKLYLQENPEKTILNGSEEYLWTNNINSPEVVKLETYQEACDMLMYIDDLQLSGDMEATECNDIVDEQGKEVFPF